MAIGWEETVPSGTSSAAQGDDEVRSLKSTLATGLAVSHYWPGTGGGSAASAGEMKLGAARVFVGTASQLSTAQLGQLMLTSDTTRLYSVGPSGIVFLGGQYAVESGSLPAAGSHYQLRSVVSSVGGIPYGVTYGAIPYVVASLVTSSAAAGLVSLNLSTSRATVSVFDAAGDAYPASAFSVHLLSLGTVAD